jgi:hypothetical protein
MEGKPSRERKQELKRVSPPLAGVGEVICGRGLDVKVMVEERQIKDPGWFKRKRVRSNFYSFNF